VGIALHRLADELTAVLAGLLGYIGVLAALGVLVIYALESDAVSAAIEPAPRSMQAAMAQPYGINEGPNRPELRRGVTPK
jgi:hypothetical protein